MTRLSSISILAVTSLWEVPWEMLVSLEERSSLILMEDGELMEEELSLERIPLRSIDPLLMLLDGWPSLL